MSRVLLHVVAGLLVLVPFGGTLLAVTQLSPGGINVRQQWIVDKTDLSLKEAPRSQFIDNPEAFSKLWKAWRTDELPKVDFSKEIVVVLTAPENAYVSIKAVLSDKGVLNFTFVSTQRVSYGMTYVIAIIDRAAIKAVGKTSLQPAK